MAELNFQVDNTALQIIQNTELKANFAEMKEALTEFVEPYTKVIVSEDAIDVAKADRAKINAVAKHVDDYRKMVKKVYTEPLKQFEDKCKELVAICDTGKNNIDLQLEEFERKRKDEKLFLLKEYYMNVEKENPEYVSFEVALHPKWQNKTTSLDECKEYINTTIQKTDTEIRTIRNLHSEWETSLLNEYSKTHDLVSALALHERLTMTAQQEAERRKKEREAYEAKLKKQEEERGENASDVPFSFDNLENSLASAIQMDNKAEIASENDESDPVYIASFRVYGTLDEIAAVRRFMNSHGIEHIYDGKEPINKPIEAFL